MKTPGKTAGRKPRGISRRRALQGLGAALGASALVSLARAAQPGGGPRPPRRAEVIIAGAGLAGLYAAWLLEQQGVSTLVVEADQRVGGRLLTLDHLPGRPEAGGQTLDAMYARALSLCDELGLKVYARQPFRIDGKAAGKTVAIRGKLVSATDWPRSPLNRLGARERDRAPDELVNAWLDPANPLRNLDDWRRSSVAADLDQLSLRAELLRLGASLEGLRWMEILHDTRGLARMSALFAYRKRQVARFGEGRFFRISGGSEALPRALAARLGDRVQLGAEIRAIETRADGTGVEFHCADGRRFAGRLALVSIPFSVLRGIRLSPAPPPELAELIGRLPYNHITQVKLAFRRPFWELDGLPPAIVSDSLFEKVFAVPAEDGRLHELNAWLDGEGAAALDRHTEAEIGERVRRSLEEARPSLKGQLAVVDVTSWGRRPWARGSYHFWGPGQVGRLGPVLERPWGPVHWIGEHTAILQQGIEGAMESAEREALAVLARLGRA
jgi:monoamine oxidase